MSTTATISNASPLDGSRRQPSDALTSRDLDRIRSEYLEMPGLGLTLPQAARMWNLNARQSERLLSALVNSGFLSCEKAVTEALEHVGLANVRAARKVLLEVAQRLNAL
jgi:hypothetical protein